MSTYRDSDDDGSSDDSNSHDESSTSSSFYDDYRDGPDWMKKFLLGSSKSNHDDRKRMLGTEIPVEEMNTQYISKSTDGMKEFERIQDEPSSTISPLPTTDDCKSDIDGDSDSSNVRNRNSLNSRSDPDSKQKSNNVQRSAERVNNTESDTRETKKFSDQSSSCPIDRAERRKRIRQNLAKLRRRERRLPPKMPNRTTMKNDIDPPENTRYQNLSGGKTANKPASSSFQRDKMKSPSIDSTVNFMRRVVIRNNMNKSAALKPRRSSAPSQKQANTPSPQIKTAPSVSSYERAESRLNDGVPESLCTDTSPPQRKTTAPAATHQKAKSRLNDDDPENQIVGTKVHSTRAVIETSVPENLFGMWGKTVKAKKPTVDASMMSDRMLRNQADKIKERIEKARKEAIQVGGHHDEDANSVGDEKSIGINIDPYESASALFHAAYDRNESFRYTNDSETLEDLYDLMVSEASVYGSDKSMEEIEASVFGSDKSTEEIEIGKFESKTNKFDGQDSIHIEEAETMEESNRDNSMNKDAAALFLGVGSDKNVVKNDVDGFEDKTNELGGEDAIDMNSAETMEESNRDHSINEDAKEPDEKKSVDDDITFSFHGTDNEKHRSEPDLNSSSSDSTDSYNDSHKRKLERVDQPETSQNESFDDLSSCSHSTDDSTLERIKKSPLEKNKKNAKLELKSENEIDSGKKEKKEPNKAVKQKDGKKKRSKGKDKRNKKKVDKDQSKKDGKTEHKDESNNTQATHSFDEGGTFVASDFSVDSRVGGEKAKKTKKANKKTSSKKNEKKK